MTDCSNAEIRDLLPDYVHDQLSNADLARVEQHVSSCADCAEEVALLQTVLAIRPSVKTPNIADIVASLPKPGQLTQVALRDSAAVAAIAGVRDISTAKSAVRKNRSFFNGRAVAAVAAVFAVAAVSFSVMRQGVLSNGVAPADSATVAEVQTRGERNPLKVLDSANSETVHGNMSLSVGDPSDYTEEELKDMMARYDKWDGSMSADPMPVVPILPPGS